jgi:redox-sensitive bicupin YhaK (pirin superfamily)
MTAGKGIVHSERTPEEDKVALDGRQVHGLQVWMALPIEVEQSSPKFTHYPKKKIPKVQISERIQADLLIGKYGSNTSPVEVFAKTLFMNFYCQNGTNQTLSFAEDEIGLLIVSGACQINGQSVSHEDLVIVEDPSKIELICDEDCHIALFGGSAFPEPRYIWWNFVSSKKELIHAAAKNWKDQNMGHVPGETELMPLPEIPLP